MIPRVRRGTAWVADDAHVVASTSVFEIAASVVVHATSTGGEPMREVHDERDV